MKITALEEYGLRCMVRLAKAGPGRALSLTEIGGAEGLSIPYSGKLLAMLREAGLVVAERGRNGGYTLAMPASQIRLKRIFDALGEPIFSANHCERYQTSGNEEGNCVHHEDCSVRDVWSSFQKMIGEFLQRVTLEDLARRKPGSRLDLFELAGYGREGGESGKLNPAESVQA
ncbi:MAG: Rrf2 family transcriptional regulator [bacterium]